MLYWECKGRLNTVREFRVRIQEYLETEDDDRRTELRVLINQDVGYVADSCRMVGESMRIDYVAAPASGGFHTKLDLLNNFFNLHSYQVSRGIVTDGLDRAIGNYERTLKLLFRRSFNPFYWLSIFLQWALSLPFRVIGFAGFDSKKLEISFGGRLFKAITALAGFVLIILSILEKIGLLDGFKDLFGL